MTTRAAFLSSRDRCSVGLSFLGEVCIVLARFVRGQSAAETGVRASQEPLSSGLRFCVRSGARSPFPAHQPGCSPSRGGLVLSPHLFCFLFL